MNSSNTKITEATLARFAREVAKYPPEQAQSAVMACLSIVQQEQGWVSAESEAVIADYLPEPLTPAEIESIVAAAIEQTGAAGEGMKAMGKVMGVVTPQTKDRADGGQVAAEVRRQLG